MVDANRLNPKGKTVVVADEHAVFVLGVVSTLRAIPRCVVVGQTTRTATMLKLIARHQPDVVVTGYNLQDDYGAVAGGPPIAEICRISPQSRIIVITPQASEALHQRVLRSGAHFVQSKACTTATLIRSVAGGPKASESDPAEGQHPALSGATKLSPTEKRVLELYLSGMNITAIASFLQRSRKTVSAQKVNAMRKLGVSSNQELILIASSFAISPPTA